MAQCPHCFREKNTNGACPFCGYDGRGQAEKYPLALQPGSILNGRYIVGHVIGQGGFGITYIAQDHRTKARVAVKEYLPTELAGRTSDGLTVQVYSGNREENFAYGKEQFLAEAKTLAAFIGDEHIVRIHSYFEENGTAYFVMDYIDGPSLDKYMKQKGGRLTPGEAGLLLLPLMESLGRVHEKGIVHRDIAPDNILIENGTSAKLIDFGAARYSTGEKSRSLDVILKHGFAPYEQYMRRGRQGPWTDVYALAATFYYAITGKVPPEAIERRDDDLIIPPSNLGVDLNYRAEEVLGEALEVLAKDRYQSMAEFHRDMQAALAGELQAEQAARGQKAGQAREEANQQERERQESLAREKAEREEKARREREARAEAERLKREEKERLAREKAEHQERERREKEEKKAAEKAAREAEKARQQAAREAARAEKQAADAGKKKSGLPLVLAALAVLALAGFFAATRLILPMRDYRSAEALLEAGQYAEAVEAFEALGTFRDAPAQARYTQAEQLLKSGQYEEAYAILKELGRDDRIESSKYERARTHLDAGEYEEAYELLTELGDQEAIAASRYERALRSIESGDFEEAYALLHGLRYQDSEEKLLEVKDGLLFGAEVGSPVFFGSYEQDNDTSNGKEDIEWLVLAKEDNRILVISRYALDSQPFNSVQDRVTWENCSLRTWLNTEFLEEAFGGTEQAVIPVVQVSADRNPEYSTSPGNSTKDQIFLLSIQEAEGYFDSDKARQCIATAWAKAQGSTVHSSTGACGWRLRSPGNIPASASGILVDGSIFAPGNTVVSNTAVRPAMWIDISEMAYARAEELETLRDVRGAIAVFEALGDYKDSTERAKKLLVESLSAAAVGDTVFFGAYEQDNDELNGKEPVEWLVLEKEENRLLVVSRCVLDCLPYNNKKEGTTWKNCSLRTWLNGDFLIEAFSKAEQAMIPIIRVSVDKNPNFSTDPGSNTEDNIFLLSITEAEIYFDSDKARQCELTAYAIARGAYTRDEYKVDGKAAGWWWLRSPGANSYYAALVCGDGSVSTKGYTVNTGYDAVRPAMWIDLSA